MTLVEFQDLVEDLEPADLATLLCDLTTVFPGLVTEEEPVNGAELVKWLSGSLLELVSVPEEE